MSQPVIRRRTPRSQRRRDGLIQHAKSIHSQNGEDGILERLFVLLPPPSSAQQVEKEITRWCVDVGAWDGQHLSNTHELLFSNSQKWRGILLEADVEKFAQLQERHNATNNICVNVTISATDEEDPQNLCNLLCQDGIPLPSTFDFLCIDIDGSDYWVWHDLLQRKQHSAQVVCIEFNPTMPDDLIYIPPRDQRHGASLAALVELANDHDYVLVETTLYNAFFVQQPLFQRYLQREVPDTSIESLHEISMGTSLYQLYDGTIKLSGCKKLLWHRITIDENKLQVLTESERNFPFAPSGEVWEQDEETSKWKDLAVDLSSFRRKESNGDERSTTCQQLLLQLETDGFALVRGTGVDSKTCQAALQATQAFLQDADESVRRSCFSPTDRARRGYAPMNVENFASLLGQPGIPNDLVRKFRIGPPSASSSNTTEEATCDNNDNQPRNNVNPLLQPNIWPTREFWDEEASSSFRTSVETFYEAACQAAHMVMQIICRGLIQKYPELGTALHPLLAGSIDRDDSTRSTTTSTTTSILTLLGYRAGTRHKGKNKGPLVAAHTDVGVITMLLYDGGDRTCAALQRKSKDGWVNVELPARVPRKDPIFVINVADCLSDLSGGHLPSTIHRVVAKRQTQHIPRNCCALFVGLDPECRLEVNGEEMTYEEWRRRRIERSQQVLKKQTNVRE